MRPARGFTLTELLVVIGIVALLVGLLLPLASAARQSAASTACLSNLRQMAAAATDYAVRSAGSYPPAQWKDADPTIQREWDFVRRGGQVAGPGFLWAPQPVTAAQQCPSFDGSAQSVGDPFTGYNYNTSYVGRGSGEAIEAPARMAAVKRPARTLLFGDGQWRLGADKFMRSPLRSPSEYSVTLADGGVMRASGTQGFRHRGATNVAFCDGHAESLRGRATGGNGNVAPGTGFVVDDAAPEDLNGLYDLE